MGAPTPPVLLSAIASAAADGGSPGDKTNPMPETSTGSNAASVEGGFPAVTMQNELSGGKPPLGQDMNGFLFLISSHTLYVECGQAYQYNSELATEIGGYLAGTILGMTDGTGLWLCTTNANTNDPDAGGAGWAPISAYGNSVVTGLTGGTVTLTPAQAKYGVVILQGVLTGNLTVNLPQYDKEWLIVNATSGAFSTTVKTAAGGSTGVVVSQGGFSAPTGVYSVADGNIYPTVAPVNLPIDQNPTPLTIVQRTNAGYVLATYFNQNSGLENPTIGSVFVQNSAADGFLRKIGLTNFEAQLLLQGMGGQVTNGQVPFSVISQWASALFSSPSFTGTPIAPTAAIGSTTGQLATTQFVNPGSLLTGGGPWYRKNPDGSIDQWGSFVYVTAGTVTHTVNFGTAFPNACQSVAFTPQTTPNVGWDTWLLGKGTASFTFSDDTASPNLGRSVTLNWQAKGT
jgi:hypothetical protein